MVIISMNKNSNNSQAADARFTRRYQINVKALKQLLIKSRDIQWENKKYCEAPWNLGKIEVGTRITLLQNNLYFTVYQKYIPK